jgi:hypothetical protein
VRATGLLVGATPGHVVVTLGRCGGSEEGSWVELLRRWCDGGRGPRHAALLLNSSVQSLFGLVRTATTISIFGLLQRTNASLYTNQLPCALSVLMQLPSPLTICAE